ncbi:unnamed protein product [Polarella glacialis]|uniref:Uncharacterized protein n=1 Tax=Polarella glacialis TaxID=89957 RepID=A0A813EK91_POLGL|nr:unnamed protein product [Polarella glacialis]
MVAVFAWYNVGWMNTRFNQLHRHEATLTADLRSAVEEYHADVVLLCDCGEIAHGLGEQRWPEKIRDILEGGPPEGVVQMFSTLVDNRIEETRAAALRARQRLGW